MPEQAVQALIDAFAREYGESLNEIRETQKNILRRLDQQDLNGDAPALKRFAKNLPRQEEVIARIERVLPRLEGMVKEDEDRSTFWREFKRIVRWNKGTKGLLLLAATMILAAIGSAIGANLAHTSEPNNAYHVTVPPAVPPVTAPAITPSPSHSHPEATP